MNTLKIIFVILAILNIIAIVIRLITEDEIDRGVCVSAIFGWICAIIYSII